MDFQLSDELTDLQRRVRRFIAEEIIPLERDPRLHGSRTGRSAAA